VTAGGVPKALDITDGDRPVRKCRKDNDAEKARAMPPRYSSSSSSSVSSNGKRSSSMNASVSSCKPTTSSNVKKEKQGKESSNLSTSVKSGVKMCDKKTSASSTNDSDNDQGANCDDDDSGDKPTHDTNTDKTQKNRSSSTDMPDAAPLSSSSSQMTPGFLQDRSLSVGDDGTIPAISPRFTTPSLPLPPGSQSPPSWWSLPMRSSSHSCICHMWPRLTDDTPLYALSSLSSPPSLSSAPSTMPDTVDAKDRLFTSLPVPPPPPSPPATLVNLELTPSMTSQDKSLTSRVTKMIDPKESEPSQVCLDNDDTPFLGSSVFGNPQRVAKRRKSQVLSSSSLSASSSS
jgi:hypothetical protein